MAEPQVAAYGTWKSPITSDLIVTGTIGLGQVVVDGDDIYWTEMRPSEGGRNIIVRRSADGAVTEITPAPFNVRTRVHEYGGGAYTVSEGVIYFSNFADQRLYRQTLEVLPAELLGGGDRRYTAPEPLSPAVDLRYANAVADPSRKRLVAVREDHTEADHEAVNTIVSVPLEPSEGGEVLAGGNDFYSSPCFSPDGSHLAWLTWNHPDMPWDGTELWVAKLKANGTPGKPEKVAGGRDESIFQPQWSPDGLLHFISDRSGWWNLYRWNDGYIEPLYDLEAEFGEPQWVFGMSTYAFVGPDRIICTYTEDGTSRLALLHTNTYALDQIELPYTEISGLVANAHYAVFGAGSPTESGAIVRLDLTTHQFEVLRRSTDVTIEAGYLSIPRPIEFPTENGLTAHAFFYAPRNQDFVAPEDEKPPLLVKSHGGPTSATSTSFNPSIQYWTSRGFGVLDVDYGGSTGYGREYRQRLNGQWGIVDVDDCVNGALYLARQGEVDEQRLTIDGGSAGGYTTLCVLTFRDSFKAGASYFGVSDLEALAKDTHKFESRYMDSMIGPYPEQRDLYIERSPINFTERLACPLILFQGLEDKVVPPSQAELMFEAVKAKGLPVAYIPFEGEQHGFRRAENIKRALDGEFYFYSKVFGFEMADKVEPVQIENLKTSDATASKSKAHSVAEAKAETEETEPEYEATAAEAEGIKVEEAPAPATTEETEPKFEATAAQSEFEAETDSLEQAESEGEVKLDNLEQTVAAEAGQAGTEEEKAGPIGEADTVGHKPGLETLPDEGSSSAESRNQGQAEEGIGENETAGEDSDRPDVPTDSPKQSIPEG